MAKKGKKAADDPERRAREDRARQLREQIRGVTGNSAPKSPREITDEAAMKEFREETGGGCATDSKER